MSAARFGVGDLVGGRYQIEGLLGEGGMAVVYRVRHTGTGRSCALKLVHAHLVAQPQLVDMFVREAQVGAKIGPNPHIVDVLDAGVDEARRVPFLVMELLHGETLEHWCERHGPMPPGLVRELFQQLADALSQAHRAGVVHRDLKPSNLFLTTDHRGQPLLKVVDFGIAKVLEADTQRTATQIGTPSYASPEQFGAMFRPLAERQGITIAAAVSPATDVWALGLIAYELLIGAACGQYWDTTTLAELPIKAVLSEHETASRRAGVRAGLLPQGFDAWFARCLRKNAPERWPSAAEAVGELARLLAGAPAASAPSVSSAAFATGPTIQGDAPAPIPAAPSAPYAAQVSGSAPYAQHAATSPPYAAHAMSGPFTPGPFTPGPFTPPPQTPAAVYGPPPGWAGGPAPFVPAPPHKPSSSGSTALVVAVLAFAATGLVIVGAIGYFALRRYHTLAAAHDCETSRTRCDEACDASHMPSCARLGALHEAGRGVPRDVVRAGELYKRACDANELDGCARLGRLYLTGRGGLGKDTAEARRLAALACDGRVPRGCTLLGELTRDGDGGVTRDDTRAAALFKDACDAGDMLACKDLGGLQEHGRGGLAKDAARAFTLYKRACEGGDAAGCNDLGVLYNNGRGTAKDEGRAAANYKLACDGGELIGCTNLGVMYEFGRGLPKDEAKAVALYTQACDEGGAGGCAALGVMHENGKGGLVKDPIKAAALYIKACDAGNVTGCFDVGTLEETGKGIAKDEAKAVTHYKRACDAGNAFGCTGLGVMTEYGRGVTKDEAKAGGLYKQACENGSLQACSNYGLMLANARGMPRDYVRAATYFKQACDGDNSAGCSNLGWQMVRGLGVPKDHARGMDLLRHGCSIGYEWACEQIKSSALLR